MADAMELRYDHVHIYASDAEEMEAWFTEKLGATVTSRSGEGKGASVFLELGGKSVLVRGPKEGENRQPASGVEQFGLHHFGFVVDDLQATAAALRERGVKFTLDPVEFRPGVYISYIEGPDKVSIEIVQRG